MSYSCVSVCAPAPTKNTGAPDLTTMQARSGLSDTTKIGKSNLTQLIVCVCVRVRACVRARSQSLNTFVQMKITLNSFRFVITPCSVWFQGNIWEGFF